MEAARSLVYQILIYLLFTLLCNYLLQHDHPFLSGKVNLYFATLTR